MTVDAYQIIRKHSEKKIIIHGRKLVLFNAPVHIAGMCTIMANALQNALCIPYITRPQHIQNGQNGMLKTQYSINLIQTGHLRYKTLQGTNI